MEIDARSTRRTLVPASFDRAMGAQRAGDVCVSSERSWVKIHCNTCAGRPPSRLSASRMACSIKFLRPTGSPASERSSSRIWRMGQHFMTRRGRLRSVAPLEPLRGAPLAAPISMYFIDFVEEMRRGKLTIPIATTGLGRVIETK